MGSGIIFIPVLVMVFSLPQKSAQGTALAVMVPEVPFHHGEGNSPAHLLSTLVGASETLFVEDGRLLLGSWQGVYLYGDYCSGRMWGLLRTADGSWQNAELFQSGFTNLCPLVSILKKLGFKEDCASC